jgi:hypothetical protein
MSFVDTPAQAVKSAIELFVFACFLADAIDQKLITPKSFQEQIRLDEGGFGLDLKAVFKDEQLKAHAHNMIIMTVGTTAMATNKAMEVVFGKEFHPNDTSPEGSGRVLLYQIRCAFAHDPLNPVWTPNINKYNHTYRVKVQVRRASGGVIERPIEFHPPSLKNKPLIPEHIGGLAGYMGLLHYFLARIEGDPKGRQTYPAPVEES